MSNSSKYSGKNKLLRAGILEEFWEKDFKDFYGHPDKIKELQPKVVKWNINNPNDLIKMDFNEGQVILERVMEYADNLENARKHGISLLLYGPNGTGKTLLAVSVLKRALEQNYKVQMTSLGGIIEVYTDAWYNPQKKEIFNSRVRNTDFLLIDDIGKEYKAKGSDLVEIAFDNLVRYRSFRNKPFILTGNTSITALTDTYGKSLSSLLYGKCIGINVTGADYRKLIQAKDLRNLLKNG